MTMGRLEARDVIADAGVFRMPFCGKQHVGPPLSVSGMSPFEESVVLVLPFVGRSIAPETSR